MENKSENALLQKIRTRTRPLHTQLEATYPFNTLQGESITEHDLSVFFSIIWSVFSPLFDDYRSPLIVAKKTIIESLKSPETLAISKPHHPLALAYVFIGSLLGGSQVIQKNPKIQKSLAKDYFFTEQKELAAEWSALLTQLKNVAPPQATQIANDCASIFELLIACGYPTESLYLRRHVSH